MTPDAAQETATDTPTAYQHAWKKAARDDPRMTTKHLAVVDAYAEHYYSRKDAMRGVGIAMDRMTYWTKLGERAIKGARADLARWGWLVVIKNHGRGYVARYALNIPEGLGITAPVIPKEGTTRTVKPSERASEKGTTRTVKAVKRAPGAHIPLPKPLHLPTRAAGPQGIGATPATPAPRRGRQESPQNRTHSPAETLRAVLPPGLADSSRLGRSAPTMAAALAAALRAGWTVEQVRVELEGSDVGAVNPFAVIVKRLRDLADCPPAAPRPASLSDTQRAAAIASGKECEHGEADVTNPATGLHVCPMCRRKATA